MKKILFILLIVSIAIYFFYSKSSNKEIIVNNDSEELKGIFISYIDYGPLLKNKNREEQKNIIEDMVLNIKDSNFNTIILQVRPFSDAIYKSDYYLSSKTVVNQEGDLLQLDILDYFIKEANYYKIKLIAWVNPYRIRNTSSIDDINIDNFYYDWFDTNKIEISEEGIYFNPADKEVKDYIILGIKEIINNYKVGGILYDDYFYPTKTIDLENYEEYKKSGDLSIQEYRIQNINTLIYETNRAIKEIDKEVMFGISPAGNINNNLNEEYLDIKYILKQDDYIDFVMPQIYYGFFNETKPFINTIDSWNALINNNIKLYPALALYKSGLEDIYAGSGKNEWIDNNDIIKKQIIISRTMSNYKGFVIYRYANFFLGDKNNLNLNEEVINLKTLF